MSYHLSSGIDRAVKRQYTFFFYFWVFFSKNISLIISWLLTPLWAWSVFQCSSDPICPRLRSGPGTVAGSKGCHISPYYTVLWCPSIHSPFQILFKCLHSHRIKEGIWSCVYKLAWIYCVQQGKRTNTHVLHSIRIFLLIEVVIKCSHVRLFEIGLERSKSAEESDRERKISKLCLNSAFYTNTESSLVAGMKTE